MICGIRLQRATILGASVIATAVLLATGCDRSAALQDTPSVPSAGPTATTTMPSGDVTVLPNNMIVHGNGTKVVALRADGEVAWELSLPAGETVAAPVTAAASSMVFVRGTKAIHAASPDGKWLWSKPLTGTSNSGNRAANAPVAMSDSTAVLLDGVEVVRLDDKGGIRWRLTLPEGTPTSRLTGTMDGSVVVPTTAGVYWVSPDGSISWRRKLGG
jgi:hypothetical protein